MKNFLLEIGVEEIPAGYINNALHVLETTFKQELKKAKLTYKKMEHFSTPRRFALQIEDLQAKQEDEIIEMVGPPKSISYDDNGKLTKAGMGFLRGANATEQDLLFVSSPKGEKLAVKKENKGKKAEEILQNIISQYFKDINFPKSMKWGSSKLSFARPLRWLIALYGDEIVPINIAGIKAGKISYGNRFQKLNNSIEINNCDEYEKKLLEVYVIPNREKRKQMITKQIEKFFLNSDERIIANNRLLETVTNLVEYPTAVIATFDEKYLELPKLVITSTLSEHQKYFSVEDNERNLANKFVFISNGDPQYSVLIKQGNEKVITARLEDAEFFYKEDLKKHFAKSVSSLSKIALPSTYNQEDAITKSKDIGITLTSNDLDDDIVSFLKFITFQGDLGTLYDKTSRIMKLANYICGELKLSKNICIDSNNAAYYCKADLSTMMLGEKEYTKLQGYIGHHYALKSNIKKNVALAIEEHYFPRNEKDNLPTAIEGSIVAIADKMDTVCGIIGVGMIPTGSKDPFALRRAGNGIVQIIANQKFEINLYKLIDEAFAKLDEKLTKSNRNKDIVYDFFKQRVNWLLKQKQFDYDIINSVMYIDHTNIPDLIHRAKALQEIKKEANFIKLVLGFKRVSNIIENTNVKLEINEKLFQEETERTLFYEYKNCNRTIEKLLLEKEYEQILLELINFGKTIDNFFDDVLVNVEDITIKNNRYNLLNVIRELFLKVADISKIVVESEK